MLRFESQIAGIPCLIEVTSYHAGRPAWLWGRPEDCYPEEYPEVEWEVLDRRGYAAAWLERKLTADDRYRIEAEAFAEMKQFIEDQKYDC